MATFWKVVSSADIGITEVVFENDELPEILRSKFLIISVVQEAGHLRLASSGFDNESDNTVV